MVLDVFITVFISYLTYLDYIFHLVKIDACNFEL